MVGGLVVLLDDAVTITCATAATTDDITAAAGKASAGAASIVVDDTVATLKFVEGVSPKCELPTVWRITKGSLVNKIVIILPTALLLSQFLPWALTSILMLGGSYLCSEGMEKVWEKIKHRIPPEQIGQEWIEAAANRTPQNEGSLVKSAVFTDLVLSVKITVILLNEVADQPLPNRALILIVIVLIVTFMVYGVMGFLVKIDDIGLHLQPKKSAGISELGTALVKTTPIVLNTTGIIGTSAMLWVSGHIMVVSLDEPGWHPPYQLVHNLKQLFTGGFLGWLANTTGSLIFGAIRGAIIAAIAAVLPFGHGKYSKSDA